MNFETQTYQGTDVLTWGQTPGEYVIFDASYRKQRQYKGRSSVEPRP
jgi:hypothetical protein